MAKAGRGDRCRASRAAPPIGSLKAMGPRAAARDAARPRCRSRRTWLLLDPGPSGSQSILRRIWSTTLRSSELAGPGGSVNVRTDTSGRRGNAANRSRSTGHSARLYCAGLISAIWPTGSKVGVIIFNQLASAVPARRDPATVDTRVSSFDDIRRPCRTRRSRSSRGASGVQVHPADG